MTPDNRVFACQGSEPQVLGHRYVSLTTFDALVEFVKDSEMYLHILVC